MQPPCNPIQRRFDYLGNLPPQLLPVIKMGNVTQSKSKSKSKSKFIIVIPWCEGFAII